MSEKARNKFYTRKKKIDGVEYTAQFNGLSSVMRAVDENYLPGSSNISAESFAEHVLSCVIVEPAGLTLEDFDSMETLQAVVKFGNEVAQGKFRHSEDKGAAKTEA